MACVDGSNMRAKPQPFRSMRCRGAIPCEIGALKTILRYRRAGDGGSIRCDSACPGWLRVKGAPMNGPGRMRGAVGELLAGRDRVSDECARLLKQLQARCPGVLPGNPVQPGAV